MAVPMPHRLKSLNVTEPLVKLLRDMDFAFDRTSDEPSSPHIKREQYAAALVAIGRFLMKFGPQHADHFFDLSDALSDLNIGARPVIFRGQKLRSVSNSTEIEAAKANVAFALDALIRLGNS